MKTPVDTVKGKIVDYDPVTEELVIRARYTDYYTMVKRNYQECLVQMVDSRPLSDKQRRSCYALLREIAEYTGMGLDPTKEYMKLKFLAEDLEETADKIFSLSDAPMSLVCAFQRFLVNFVVDWGIPTRFPLIDIVDDIDNYVYACAIHKKCVVCGEHADLHHVNPIGMGRDREEIIHEGLEVLPLCRIHHNEMHQYTKERFFSMYHIDHGIKADKAICKVYGLNENKEETA